MARSRSTQGGTRVLAAEQAEPRPAARSARRPRALWVAGALAALLLLAVLVPRLGQHAAAPSAPAQGTGQPTARAGQGSDQAAGTAAGVPVGYPRTQDGALSAAANYAVAYGSAAMANDALRPGIIAAIADPAAAAGLESQLDAAMAQVHKGLGLSSGGQAPAGETFVCWTAPIAVSVLSYTPAAAQVQVWAVNVCGVAGVKSTAPVTSTFQTLTVTLTWARGDWKWDAFGAQAGPVPVPGQDVSTTGDMAQLASGFGGLRYAR